MSVSTGESQFKSMLKKNINQKKSNSIESSPKKESELRVMFVTSNHTTYQITTLMTNDTFIFMVNLRLLLHINN